MNESIALIHIPEASKYRQYHLNLSTMISKIMKITTPIKVKKWITYLSKRRKMDMKLNSPQDIRLAQINEDLQANSHSMI